LEVEMKHFLVRECISCRDKFIPPAWSNNKNALQAALYSTRCKACATELDTGKPSEGIRDPEKLRDSGGGYRILKSVRGLGG
jgi:hypothetical protein